MSWVNAESGVADTVAADVGWRGFIAPSHKFPMSTLLNIANIKPFIILDVDCFRKSLLLV